MGDRIGLRVDGLVGRPTEFSFDRLSSIDAQYQIIDVSRVDPSRQGDAVSLEGILATVDVLAEARYLGLHASRDDFHASVPLEPLRDRAILIYRHEGRPLSPEQGGPVRFYIPDFAACHTGEIDECANVKFIDHLEFTAETGFDNRPDDDADHAELHRRQNEK